MEGLTGLALIDAEYDLERSVAWKPVGEKTADGWRPCVRRAYRLKDYPLVHGELSYSHMAGGKAWWSFKASAAMHVHLDRLVRIEHVEEVAG
jgi:hypothetical protein